MLLERFKEKVSKWDFKYKWFNITLVPNWGSHWQNCIACRWKTNYRWTEEDIYNLLYRYKNTVLRKDTISKIINN